MTPVMIAGVWLAIAGGGQNATADKPSGGCEPAWHQLTSDGQIGVNNWVNDLTVWNGDLVVAGDFTTAGGQTVNGIARWDGVSGAWQPFTSGGQTGVGGGTVFDLTVWNGDLVASGNFTTAGGQTVNFIARWDGSAWHQLTSGGQIGVSGGILPVSALTVWNGDLIAGGGLTMAGGQTVNRIARWDGSAWHPFTSGGPIGVSGAVWTLTEWNGDLIAGGSFTTAGGQTVNRIARWDGVSGEWQSFTSGEEIGVGVGSVRALTVWNGDLIAGGVFTTAGGQTVNRIARWDGSSGGWHPFASGGQIGVDGGSSPTVFALTLWNDDLIAAGQFTTAGDQTVNRIARWDGVSGGWHPFTSGGQIGVSGTVNDLTVWNSDVITGGGFTMAGGQTVNRIARWDGCLDPPCAGPADLNCDDMVDVDDLFILLAAWGDCPDPDDCPADLDENGVVDVDDLFILLANWS